jgi:tetratricopeptide (TPR) repeat protein
MAMKKTGKTDETETGATREPIADEASQRACFAEGVRLFTTGDYANAQDVFARAATGPALPVTESAAMYLRMCERRLERSRMMSSSAEQELARGRELLAQQRHSEALAHLEAAARSLDTAELHYALTLTAGHMGDVSAAARHFRRACEIAPESRAAALRDPAFRILLQFAEIREAATDRG